MAERLVALLRGINVGKNKRVAMADLRRLLADLGYTEIVTHLNSGNAVFTSTAKLTKGAEQRIQAGIADQLGVDCAVMIRTGGELADIVAGDPFAKVATDPSRYLVGFLSGKVAATPARAIEHGDYGDDQIKIVDRHAYLWCSAGLIASPLNKLNWPRELDVSVTTRNWNTVLKLADLAAG